MSTVLEPYEDAVELKLPATTKVNWAIVNEEEVARAAEMAAGQVASNFGGVIEYADLHQEALILLATEHDIVRRYLSDEHMGPRFLHKWLWSRLTDYARREARYASRNVPLHVVAEAGETSDRG